MKSMSSVAVLLAALASGPALAHGHSFHGSHASYHGGGWHGGGHWHGHVGVFIGAPLFWPWYYPPAYYAPPAYYYPPPPVVVTSPPQVVVAPPPTTTYYPPIAATPGSPGNPVIELPNNEPVQPSQAQPPQARQQAAPPPAGNPAAAAHSDDMLAQLPSTQVFMYPKQGQSEQQQAKDRDECYRWAMGQIGASTNQSGSQLSPTQTSNYYRAMGACLDARGYSVR